MTTEELMDEIAKNAKDFAIWLYKNRWYHYDEKNRHMVIYS